MQTPEEAERLEVKQQFYNGLASLDESDDEADVGLQESVNTLRRPYRASSSGQAKETGEGSTGRATGKPSAVEKLRSLPRSVSDVGPLATHTSPNRSQVVATHAPEKPKNMAPDVAKARPASFGALPPSSSIPQAIGKRKRENAVKPMPKDQQIFHGFHFYFFPNNEKHPARFMRITKAIAFGATWQRDWNSHVTHVVLDKSMDYSMLLKLLKKDNLPTEIVVVNESWPSECIAYRTLLDVSRPQFKVLGAPIAAQHAVIPPPQPPASSADSDKSLKLKPAGRDVMSRQPETQSPDEPTRQTRSTTKRTSSGLGKPTTEPTGNAPTTNELDAAISQARDLQMVPLDDEEVGSRPNSSDGPSALSAQVSVNFQPNRKAQNFSDKFQCMQKHTGENSNNANAATIVILQQMADYYGQMGDEWRIRAYRKAIATLRNHPTKVCTREEALALPNVGDRLATKIEEIAFTNRLRRLDSALAEPQDQILQTFMKVYGAGFVHASQWVRQGFTTLDELLEKADLTENQKIGIDHFEDFQERIPRAEVTQHGDIVRQAVHKLDPAFQITIGGSYRRGAKDSGDIDFIITRPETGIDHIRAVVVEQLVPALFSQGFLKASLAATSGDGSKWHGACCLPGSKTWRRIDFLLVPWAEMGAALIYFTGNDIFNRSLRLLASTKGFRLNQRGLYKDVIRGKKRERVTEGTLVEGRDERRIFEILGVPWRPPEHRIP